MPCERSLVDRPAGKLHGMQDPGLDLHDFEDERLDDVHRNPGGAEARGDLARLEIDRLDSLERGCDGEESWIGLGLLARQGELGADRTRKNFVGRDPVIEMRCAADGVERDITRKIGERLGLGDAEHAGDQGDVDAAALME